MKILVFGKNGQIGRELIRSLSPIGHIISIDRKSADLTKEIEIRSIIHTHSPDIIINAAAFTKVDQAEVDQEEAFLVNARAPKVIAEEAYHKGILFIHYSTDYIFNGQKNAPYVEEDTPHPLNVYGLSKLEGEKAILEVGGKFLIFRTSWVYGTHGNNFLLNMLKLAKKKDELNIVADSLGIPTWSRFIAEATLSILSKIFERKGFSNWGVYHLSQEGETSWYHFAEEIFRYQKKEVKLNKISSSEYIAKANRPLYSVLSNDKIQKTFNLFIPNWKDSLYLALDELDLESKFFLHTS